MMGVKGYSIIFKMFEELKFKISFLFVDIFMVMIL